MEKPKLIIAGPGSGKTHNLVDEIIICIEQLKPHRTLAAITYTNAATASIKGRIEKKLKLPANVFIGTTYSFFNAFILLPFASLFGLVELDKLFIEYDIEGKAEEITKKKSFDEPTDRAKYKKTVAANIIKGMLDKGIVPFEQIAKISSELIANKKVRSLVGERLQFLFVDEFQDATSHQYTIFDHIRKEKKTAIYAVGDPEQYISNYTIKKTKPHFAKLPIMAFQGSSQVEKRIDNKRSSITITTFINNFNTQIQQKSDYLGITSTGVYFINNVELGLIIEKFWTISKDVESIENFKRYYLSYTNAAFDNVSEKYHLKRSTNENMKPHSKLLEACKLISEAVHLSPKKFCEIYKLDLVEFRTLGIKLLQAPVSSIDELSIFLTRVLKLTISPDASIEKLFFTYQTIKTANTEIASTEITSSIHKSKGLEAEAVLVVARTNKELSKWLETEKSVRHEDKTDDHRLGFVAFSRAKEILCIACLQKIDSRNKEKLENLKVLFP